MNETARGKIGPGKSAQAAHEDTTRIAGRLFWAPAPRRMVVPILGLSLFGAFLVTYPEPIETSIDDLVYRAIFVFAVPALASAGATKLLAEALGGRMYLRRSTLMSFLGLVIVDVILLFATVGLTLFSLATGTPYVFSVQRVVLLGYAAVLWVRAVILAGTSQSNYLGSLPAAVLHPVLGLLGLAAFVPTTLGDWLTAVLVFAIFLSTAIGFTEIAKRPLQRTFGVNGLKLMRYTLDHFTELGDEGRDEIESFFTSISVPTRIRVGLATFRTARGTKAVFLAPMVHPGPMGYIGGSDLPAKLRSRLEDGVGTVLVAHGPTTHDENPANTKELEKLVPLVRELIRGTQLSPDASPMVRVRSGKANVCVQVFGTRALIVASLAPNPTDDIEGAVGFAATQEARLAGVEDAVFVDAHNCMEVGSGLTHFGTAAAHDIIEGTRSAVKEALGAPRGPLRVGVASKRDIANPGEGIGSEGVQALVTEVAGRKTAFVLFDGNNMIPGLRDKIREKLAPLLDDVEVLTTDNHSVNVTLGGFNPVGLQQDHGALVEATVKVVQEAIATLEPSEAGIASGYAADLYVWGPESAARLTTSVNSTIAILRPAFVATFLLALTASVLSLFLLD
jgi:putative membrane protein